MRLGARRALDAYMARLPEIRASGVTATLLEPIIHHYRLVGPMGLVIDFWPTTSTWMRQGSRTKEKGLDAALSALASEAAEEKNVRMVTIFTDASYNHESKAAGWAAWCKGGQAPGELISGQIKAEPASAEIAEAMAICNGLYAARRKGLIQPKAAVMVQSDCINALGKIRHHIPEVQNSTAINGLYVPVRQRYVATRRGRAKSDASKKRKAAREQYDEVLESIAGLVKDMQISLIVRHVKAHTGASDARSWVNALCDKAARKHMRDRHQEIGGKAA
jgi:ribonuclease HI